MIYTSVSQARVLRLRGGVVAAEMFYEGLVKGLAKIPSQVNGCDGRSSADEHLHE
jgi:hypothetical protein